MKKKESNGLENFGIEEETPNLFDESNNSEETFEENSELSDQSFDNEEDEYEIPAFLRRQKN